MAIRWIIPIGALFVSLGLTSADAEALVITMQNMGIAPSESPAKVGDTVQWVNNDMFDHTATARNGDWDVTIPA
jgi:plastocyanin